MTEHPLYERGLALFDAGRWFEAHEVLEDLWRETTGPDREFYQGLIQLAVVLHHVSRDNPTGAANVSATCRRHLAPYVPRHAGLDVGALLSVLDRVEAGLARRPLEVPEVPALSPRSPAGR